MSISSGENLNLCVITFPLQNYVPLVRLVRTLEPLANNITLITGNFPNVSVADNVTVINVKNDQKQQTMLLRIPKYVITQLKITYQLIKTYKKTDIVLFFVGGFGLVLPMVTAKLLRKKVILSMAGSGTRSAVGVYKNTLWGAGSVIFPRLIALLEKLNFRMSDRIVVYAPSSIYFYKLDKFRSKISIAHEHFLDFNTFRIERKLNKRNDLIGYLGRLSEEKGVINFVRAIPGVLKINRTARFLIIGQGPLKFEIQKFIKEHKLENQVGIQDWIDSEEIPKYLNRLKLLILPSYTEGLPNIILEAMACGTPALTTPVGNVPDLIEDGETGFILESNKPESIVTGIQRALNHTKLDEIVEKARRFVEQNYTYEKAVAGYRSVLTSIK
ncbi:glycosyltransferase family 4 protein [Chloroflexota bacterium]